MALGPATTSLVEKVAKRFVGLSFRVRNRVAIVLCVAFAGQLGATWMFSIAREHARGQIALEHSQALHRISAELLEKASDADGNVNAYRTFAGAAPKLFAQLESLVRSESVV